MSITLFDICLFKSATVPAGYLNRTFKTIIFTYEIKFSTDMSSQLSHFWQKNDPQPTHLIPLSLFTIQNAYFPPNFISSSCVPCSTIFPFVKHKNPIGKLGRANSVGYDKRRLPLRHPLQTCGYKRVSPAGRYWPVGSSSTIMSCSL